MIQTVRKNTWKVGEDKAIEMQFCLQVLIDLTDMIIEAEKRYYEHVANAMDCNTPELAFMRRMWTHKADISKRAAIRLRKYLNSSLNDLSL